MERQQERGAEPVNPADPALGSQCPPLHPPCEAQGQNYSTNQRGGLLGAHADIFKQALVSPSGAGCVSLLPPPPPIGMRGVTHSPGRHLGPSSPFKTQQLAARVFLPPLCFTSPSDMAGLSVSRGSSDVAPLTLRLRPLKVASSLGSFSGVLPSGSAAVLPWALQPEGSGGAV